MIFWGASALLMAMLAGLAEEQPRPQRGTRITVHEQIVVRVPMGGRPQGNANIKWKEGKGPKCVPTRSVIGATLLGKESVDLILRGGGRVRAELENSCPALDYYHGFYVSPNADGMICADRDAIRSRMGGQCGIDRFRTLKPVVKR